MRLGRWLAALALASAATAAAPAVARADDSQPTQWQIDANAEALQYAPEPAVKPVICIVDYGVTPTPDLDIVNRQALDGGTPDDVTATPGNFGHGTTVAHMAAGKVNGWGASGVFPQARIASVRIFSKPGERVPWQRYIAALQRCAAMHPRPVVAVLSLGGPAATPSESAELQDQLATSRRLMTVVAAAGNSGGAADMPARLPSALSVTSGASDGTLCVFSARGENVDLMAPGCGIGQAGWDGAPWQLQGTSFSAPVVAGTIAALRAYRPDLEVEDAERLVMETADSGALPQINVGAALRRANLQEIAEASAPQALTPVTDADPLPAASPDATQDVSRDAARQPSLATETRRHEPGAATERQISLKQFPQPRLTTRRVRRLLAVTVLNRPREANIEIESATRRRTIRGSTFKTVLGRRRIRVRFVGELRVSRWVRLPRTARRRSSLLDRVPTTHG